MNRYIPLFEDFKLNESTTDGTIESLIDVTKIAVNMGVFDDSLLKDVKQNFIQGIRGSLKTETDKIRPEKRKQFKQLMDSLISPLETANTMNKFIMSLELIAKTKDNIVSRLSEGEIILESRLVNWLKTAKKSSKDWWETNKKNIVKKISDILINIFKGIFSTAATHINESVLNEFNTYSGEEVAQHIEDITPEESDIPDYFINKYIKPNDGWKIMAVDLNKLLKTDKDFAEYYKSGEVRYEDDEVSEWDLDQELVVYKGELLDGYSRASVMLRRGDRKASAFVLDK